VIPGSASVTVLATDGVATRTYTVYFRYKSQEAGLSSISIDGVALPGFDKDTYEYLLIGLPDRTLFDASNVVFSKIDEKATSVLNITETKTGDGYFRKIILDIQVTAEDGVTHHTYQVDLNFLLSGIDDPLVTARLVAYPNPSGGRFEMEYYHPERTGSQLGISLTDLSGRVVYSRAISAAGNKTTLTINLTDCGPGTYFLSVRNGTRVLMKKIIIE
jgi:hypothetical protein